jgi:hypothetical protein
MYAEGDAT